MGSLEEYKLIQEKLINHDQKTWKQLYSETRPIVINYITSNSGSTEEATDVLQDSFCILISKLKNKEFDLVAKPSTYLYSISRNIWLNQLRKNKKKESSNTLNTLEIPEMEIDDTKEILYQTLEKGLKKLGETCFKIIEQFYYHKISMEKIAVNLGLKNSDTVKAQKYRCLKQLQSLCK